MKKFVSILLAFALIVGFGSIAFADIFGSKDTDLIVIGQKTKGVEDIPTYDTALDVFTAFLTTLGTREGILYDGMNQEFTNYLGATVYTKYNFALDVGLVGTNGIGATLDYNVGSFLNVDNMPILQYLKYLYVGGGGAYRPNMDHEGTWVADAQFKLTF